MKSMILTRITRQKLVVSLALVLFTIPAGAGSLVYVVTGAQQFGTVDLGTGAFNPIGPGTPEGADGLVYGPNGSLLTLTFSGNLDSINPATGVTTVIGATGLADCTNAMSPCGLKSASTLGQLGGTIYATDFDNRLYSVNPLTGKATLIGPTVGPSGIPAVTFNPSVVASDGSFNAFDETQFSAGGNLYATFDTILIETSPSFTVTPVISPELYQIDPSTGLAAKIDPTQLTLGATVNLNGTIYSFDNMDSQVVTLDLANGSPSVVGGFDPAVGLILGAAAVPEPTSIALAAIGIAAIGACRRRGGRRTESLHHILL